MMPFKKLASRHREPERTQSMDDLVQEVRQLRRYQDSMYLKMQGLVALYELLPIRNVLPLIPRASGAGSPLLLHRLVSEILSVRPRQGLECGAGISTLIGGYAIELLGTGGRWTAIEHDLEWHQRVSSWVSDHGLESTVEVVYAPLIEHELAVVPDEQFQWYDLRSLEVDAPAQVLLVDGPPGQSNPKARYPAAHLLQNFVADGARVIVDDYGRIGEQNMVKAWIEHGLISDVVTLPKLKGIAIGNLHTRTAQINQNE